MDVLVAGAAGNHVQGLSLRLLLLLGRGRRAGPDGGLQRSSKRVQALYGHMVGSRSWSCMRIQHPCPLSWSRALLVVVP